MAVTNGLRPQVHSPIWRQTRYMPAVSTALSSACSADNSNFNAQFGRYIYYLIAAATFWRYDTWTDTVIGLTAPPVAPATWSAMEFLDMEGFEGRVLSATSTTMTIPAYSGQALASYDVHIVSGTGLGQRRIVTSVSEPTVGDSGIVTGVNNAQGLINLSDTTKAWTVNQWAGAQCRIIFGAGVGQVRRILYNSSNELFLGDSTKSADDYNCNPGIFSPAIGAVAGSQSVYAIETSVATVDTAWDTTPDSTSRFRLSSGGIFLLSSAAAAPFFTLQFYDIVSDTWYIRTSCSGLVNVVGAEGSLEQAGESCSVWYRGSANGTSTTTALQDLNSAGTSTPWNPGQWVGYYVFIFSGTSRGQLRKITASTVNTLTWTSALGTAPDATSQYFIIGYTAGTATSGSTTTLTDTTATWPVNAWANYKVRILAGTGIGQTGIIVSNTATVLTFAFPLNTAPDVTSVYAITTDGDKVFMHTSGSAAFPIHNTDDDIQTYGRLQDSGSARQGSVAASSPNAYGIMKPQAISTITFATTTATVTMVNSHNFVVGQSVTVSGATGADASKYNGTFVITAVASITTFTYTMSGTPAANAVFTGHSTTTITDATQAWTTNQFAGMTVTYTSTVVTAASGAATTLTALIASNTATTLTFAATATAPTNGVSRYVIAPLHIIGVPTTAEAGFATSGSTTTLVDTSKAWVVNLYAGRKVKMTGGTGAAQELTIASNTANTLTFALAVAPAANTTYAILSQPIRGTGANLIWAFNGVNNQTPNARYMYSARGGAVVGFDRVDLTNDTISLLPITPQLETLTAGSQYAYDGANRLYFSKIDATPEQRLYYLDLTTYTVHGAGMTPYTAPTATASNRMEVFRTKDNLAYLWIQQGAANTAFRTLLFW